VHTGVNEFKLIPYLLNVEKQLQDWKVVISHESKFLLAVPLARITLYVN
jgi:hypothetical protein